MVYDNEKGQTSLFFLIILVPIIIVSIVFIDITRMHAAEKQVEDTIRRAAKSVLAGYSSKLKEEYGLFALGPRDGNSIETEIRKYIENNLGIEEDKNREKGIRLYDYRIENLEVTPIFNLTENEVTRMEILEYMKYRAPKSLIEGFIEKLHLFGKSSKMAGAYKKKTAIDKALADMDSAIRELKHYTEGWAGGHKTPVNSFNKNCSRKQLIESIVDDILDRRILAGKLAEAEHNVSYFAQLVNMQEEYLVRINSEIHRLRELLEQPDADEGLTDELNGLLQLAEEQMKKLENFQEELDEATGHIDSIGIRISGIEMSIVEKWTRLVEAETLPFIMANNRAFDAAKKIENRGEIVKAAVEELRQYLSRAEIGDSLTEPFLSELENEMLDGTASLLQDEVIRRIRESLQANIDILNEMKETLEQYDEMIRKEYNLPGDRDSMISLLTGRQHEYVHSITVEYERVGQDRKDKDPRAGTLKNAADFFKQQALQYGDIAKAGFDINELPSVKKAKGNYPESTSIYEGDSTQLENEINFSEKNSLFVPNAFGFVEALGGGIGKELKGLRDELYINEYILDTFYNVTDREGRDRNSLFEGEVEYIIHGMPSGKLNRLAVRGEITLLRFAMNTLHVYTDARKKAMAASLATAIAGWWTGGAGIPIISNMIMSCWGMGEALLDVQSLLKGEEVPFYKTKSDWKLDIGLPGGEEGKDMASLGVKFDYEDYLRLFLLIVDSDRKMDRIEDLICLNLFDEGHEWQLERYNTCLKVEATVSVNYLFIPGIFTAAGNTGIGNRKDFSITIYEGYQGGKS